MRDFETLSEAMNSLREEGYVEDFNLKQNCLECRNGACKIFTNEFKLKGQLVNGYGIYSNVITNEMLNKLKTH